ncbi:DinB family protein [Muriicola soli]|uniref:DUF1572 domain-containing protein n=1 Tax=Muriicola soli TaxID=2507538 RepID=A0A411E958_9FLAO|nr:DinB family protein [Muriicola soli]QBA64212.1 DUF1572 domain-containing protein [Muriicola soli]
MSSTESLLCNEIKKNTIFRMEESLRMVHLSLKEVDDAEIWRRPNEASNSIGNILVHLCGNITQYILSGLDGQEDLRQRDAEFSIRQGVNKNELLSNLSDLIQQVKSVVNGLSPEQLTTVYKVQGFDLSGFGVLLHVVEHFSYHTGQIAFWVKCLKDKDLEFYSGIDLNAKNEK